MSRSFFNLTGYTLSAMFLFTTALALAIGILRIDYEGNGVVGLLLLAGGAISAAYAVTGVLLALAAWAWRIARRDRGSMPRVVPGRAVAAAGIALVAAVAGAAMAERTSGGLEDFLNLASFFVLSVVISMSAVVVVATAIVWATEAAPRPVRINSREEEGDRRHSDGPFGM